jgi:hypothetical protein
MKTQTARAIWRKNNRTDRMASERTTAAGIMVLHGYGNWPYVTQWASGSCLFRHPRKERTAIVRWNKDISRYTIDIATG